MKRMMKEFKKYKYTTIAIIIFLVLLLLGYFTYTALFGSRGVPLYGNRLDGIDAVMPSDDDKSKVINALKAIDEVSDATFTISGRTISIVTKVKAGTAMDKAKSIPSVVIANLLQDQTSYFDIQVFIECENKDEANYPIIAYKGKEATEFSFSYNKQEA